jgi:hypothetical protein
MVRAVVAVPKSLEEQAHLAFGQTKDSLDLGLQRLGPPMSSYTQWHAEAAGAALGRREGI